MARAMQAYVDGFERAPVLVLPCLVRYREPTPAEGASVYPACQNLLLAARALGFGGVLTLWHGFVEAELRPLLGIPDGVFMAATITIGKPVGNHGPVRRRPLPELVFGDQLGRSARVGRRPARHHASPARGRRGGDDRARSNPQCAASRERRAGFAERVDDDHESRGRIGPPPAGRRVERESEQNGGREGRVEERDVPLGLQDRVVRARPVAALPRRGRASPPQSPRSSRSRAGSGADGGGRGV